MTAKTRRWNDGEEATDAATVAILMHMGMWTSTHRSIERHLMHAQRIEVVATDSISRFYFRYFAEARWAFRGTNGHSNGVDRW